MTQQGEPRRFLPTALGAVVHGQNSADHILVDFDAKGFGQVLGNLRTAKTGIALLEFTDGSDQFPRGSFWTWLLLRTRGVEESILEILEPNMKAQQGGGLVMAVRKSRPGLRNCAQNPKSTRSAVRRLGARRQDCRITKDCCLRMRFSASTALIPPLPRTVIRPASRRKIGQNQYSISIILPMSTNKASKGSQCTATANSP